MDIDPEKASFHNFIKGIPEETLEQQLGYVDPGKTTQLLLYPEPEPIITCIQKNAVCSPDTLGKYLGLHSRQVSQVIEAHTGNRGLQIRHVICCWIEANESKATVRALLEGLWHSDDTNALTCVQDLELEVVQGSRRKEDLNAAEDMLVSDSMLPPGSQFVPAPFQRTGSLDHQTVVVMPNGTLAQRTLHKDGSTDSTTDEPVHETVSILPTTCAVLPSFLLQKAKPEVLPLELTRQQPHESTQSSVPSTETEIVAVSEIRSIKPSQESMGGIKEELSRLKESFGELQLQTDEAIKKGGYIEKQPMEFGEVETSSSAEPNSTSPPDEDSSSVSDEVDSAETQEHHLQDHGRLDSDQFSCPPCAYDSEKVNFIDQPEVVMFNSRGGVYRNSLHGITLIVPEGAVPDRKSIHIQVGVALYGPFVWPKHGNIVSPIVGLCMVQPGNEVIELQQPVELRIPHFIKCSEVEDCKNLTFLKANHVSDIVTVDGKPKYSLKPFHIQQTDGEHIHFEPGLSFGTLHTKHFCYLCIAEKYTRKCTEKANFCLMGAMPDPPRKSFELYFCVSYMLDTCMKSMQSLFEMKFKGVQFKTIYPWTFNFTGSGQESRLAIHLEEKEAERFGWVICLQSPEEILTSEIDFWNIELPELMTKQTLGVYPPCFVLSISGTSALRSTRLDVSFSGGNKVMKIQIPLQTGKRSPENFEEGKQGIPCFKHGALSTKDGLGAEKPQLVQLSMLKTTEGQKVRIIQDLAPKWKNFGTYLDFDSGGQKLDLIEAEHKTNGPVACCQAMFRRPWLHLPALTRHRCSKRNPYEKVHQTDLRRHSLSP